MADCMILYDSENRSNAIETTVAEIKYYLDECSILVTLPQDNMLPGDDITDTLATLMTSADVAIVVIASGPSTIFYDLISRAVDRRKRVIPLFCDMREGDMKQLVDEKLPFLSNTHTTLNSGAYLESLEQAIRQEESAYNLIT